jgi:hypothetical protein
MKLLVLLLALLVPPTAPLDARAENESLRRFFGRLTAVLDDALDRLDRDAALPASSWNPFEETKASNEVRLNALLDECAALLAQGDAIDIRSRIRALTAERRDLDETIRVALERQTTAQPRADRSWYRVFGSTREDFAAAEEKARARQAAIDEEIAKLKVDFAAHLRRLGLELGTDGADALLASVAGDRFVDMAVAFDNVRIVTEELRRIAERMPASADAAKRYYGMYVLLVRVMDRIQDAFVQHVDATALPRIKGFADEADRTERDARRLLRTATEADRPLVERNIAACRLAIQAATNYSAYLAAQRDRIRELNRGVEERLKIAENTYRTMAVSVGLAELMRQGELDLMAVLSLELPNLKGFDDAALREQYERLTERLRAP